MERRNGEFRTRVCRLLRNGEVPVESQLNVLYTVANKIMLLGYRIIGDRLKNGNKSKELNITKIWLF